MAKLIGVGGSVHVSTSAYPVSTWSANISNEVQDVSDTGSPLDTNNIPYVNRIFGFNSGEFSFTAFWGSSASLLSDTFAIGTSVTAIFNIGSSGLTFSVSGVIASFTVTNAAKTPVEFQCTIQSNGAVTMPTSS